jgi:hypothetical protein
MSWRQNLNKSTAKSSAPKPKFDTKDDDWETDTAYEVCCFFLRILKLISFAQNSVTEKTQRYGSTSIPGSGRVDHIDFNSIQEKIKSADSSVTDVYQDKNPNRGYGGKYGVEQVMDKVNDYFLFISLITKKKKI